VLKRDNINGINENKTTLQTRVYPNPSNGVLQLLINSPQKATLTVFNAAGETVSERVGFLSGTLDLSHLVNGLYYLHVTMQNGETTNQRILISR
jgi:hypothetical protein